MTAISRSQSDPSAYSVSILWGEPVRRSGCGGRVFRESVPAPPPVVTLDDYFTGNSEEECIAPNQVGFGRSPLADLYDQLSAQIILYSLGGRTGNL